eukprot:gene7380-13123_t
MKIAKSVRKFGILLGCEDCNRNASMDKRSLHYQKWVKFAAYTRWENEHENGIGECYGVKKLGCIGKPYHLDEVFLEFLLPLFDRLCSTSLRKRCLPGLSQNVNESFDSLIWIRCPKHQNKRMKVDEVATGSAVLQFNVGATGKHALMDILGIAMGNYTEHCSNKKDQRRIVQSSARLRQRFKRAREVIRQEKLEKKNGSRVW